MKKLILFGLLMFTACTNKRNVLFRVKPLYQDFDDNYREANNVEIRSLDSAFQIGDTIDGGFWNSEAIILQRVK